MLSIGLSPYKYAFNLSPYEYNLDLPRLIQKSTYLVKYGTQLHKCNLLKLNRQNTHSDETKYNNLYKMQKNFLMQNLSLLQSVIYSNINQNQIFWLKV